jgi:dethiobiotin synthetase
MKPVLIITGTDTGVGKTVLAVLLVRFLRECGLNAAALKPICSGGRADARKIFAAMEGALSLDEINPWHFRAAIAPMLAARRENRKVRLTQILAHVRALQSRFELLLVEGAGGLLSPLGENFNSRNLILALRATPLIVAPDQLGAVNHLLLSLEALPGNIRRRARLVLMSPPKPDIATDTNAELLAEFFDTKRIFRLPRLGETFSAGKVLKNPQVRRTLRALASSPDADCRPSRL